MLQNKQIYVQQQATEKKLTDICSFLQFQIQEHRHCKQFAHCSHS